MKKGRTFLILFVIFAVLSSSVIAVQGENSTEEAYQKAIHSIEAWIETIPKDSYQKAEKDQKFQWKVGLEENSRGKARFIYYENLLDEIGNTEFVYENYVFNNKTIRCFQFKHYGDYYSEVAQQKLLEPNQFFKRQYEFYKENITTKKEQWVWLSNFFTFFSSSSLYGAEESKFVKSLTENSYSRLAKVLNQYLILSKYMLENNPDLTQKGDIIYYDEESGYVTMGTPIYNVFNPLVSFVKRFKQKLKEDEKQTILNFIIPEYQDTDQAVKIYKELK